MQAEQDIRALAGLPVGRVGSPFSSSASSASVSLSFALFFCLYLLSPPPLSFHLRGISRSLALSTFLATSLSLRRSPARLPPTEPLLLATVLLLLLLSYAAAIRTHHRTPPSHHHVRGGHFPLLGPHGPPSPPPPLLLAPRKMRILIRYCLILFMYARARDPAHFKPFPSHPCRLGNLPPNEGGGEGRGEERRAECIRAMNPLVAPPSALLRPRYQRRPRFPRGLYFMQIFFGFKGEIFVGSSWHARTRDSCQMCKKKNVSKRGGVG